MATLRQNVGGFAHMTGATATLARARVNVELVDKLLQLDRSIKTLNESSSELVGTTNRLTKRILYLTVVGIVLAAVGAAEVVRRWLVPS